MVGNRGGLSKGTVELQPPDFCCAMLNLGSYSALFYFWIQMFEIFNLNLYFCFGNSAKDCEIVVSTFLTCYNKITTI